MTPEQMRELADRLTAGTHYVDSPELHEAMMKAADFLRQCAEAKPVAWLHDVVQDGDEPDQALSFYRDSFPLEGVGGFRSVGCVPLYTRPAPAVPPASI